MEGIVNRVSASQLVSIDFEEYYPKADKVVFDLKDNLYQGLVLKEKDFREFVKQHDWTQYEGKYVAITCSTDAIIPTWAFMLVASKITPYAKDVVNGDLISLNDHLLNLAINKINPDDFQGAKVVVKGCANIELSEAAYINLSKKLTPVVSSLMFGEPCSTVPIYKKPKN